MLSEAQLDLESSKVWLLCSLGHSSVPVLLKYSVPKCASGISRILFEAYVRRAEIQKTSNNPTVSNLMLANIEHSKSWLAKVLDGMQVERGPKRDSCSLVGNHFSGRMFDGLMMVSNTC